jgi:hypothetical protein
MLRVAWRKGLEPDSFVLKVSGDQLSDRVEHEAHRSPGGSFRPLFPVIVVESVFNLVHAMTGQNNQTFTMRRRRGDGDGAGSRDVLVVNGSFLLFRSLPETMS